jgi:hypothetical protein
MFRPESGRRSWRALPTGVAMMLAVTLIGPQMAKAEEVQWNWGTSRQLRTCPDKTNPKKGNLTVALVSTYVACSYEERDPYNASVTFVDVVKIQSAVKRKVNGRDIGLWPDIDQSRPVYVLRGSIVVHTCANITGNATGPQQGENCSRSDLPKAKGTCWVDVVGEWSCYLGGIDPSPKRKQPAPQ